MIGSKDDMACHHSILRVSSSFQKWAHNHSRPNRLSNVMCLLSIFFHKTDIFWSNLCWLNFARGLLWIWNIHEASDIFSDPLEAYGNEELVQSPETYKGLSVYHVCLKVFLYVQIDQMGISSGVCSLYPHRAGRESHVASSWISRKMTGFLSISGWTAWRSTAGPGHANLVLRLREQRTWEIKLDDAVTALIFSIYFYLTLVCGKEGWIADRSHTDWELASVWAKRASLPPFNNFLSNEMNNPENAMLGAEKCPLQEKQSWRGK